MKYLIYSRLVAIVFHPNPNNLPEVNHKNGIRWDNRPCNLEWSTSKNNMEHAILELGDSRERKKILQMNMDGSFVKEWDSIWLAAKSLGKSAGNITSTCKGRFNYAYGYKWKYKID